MIAYMIYISNIKNSMNIKNDKTKTIHLKYSKTKRIYSKRFKKRDKTNIIVLNIKTQIVVSIR